MGHTVVDSHGAVASPAMTVWDNGSQKTLVLIWGGGDGTVYLATGMEQAGAINASPIPKVTTLERQALVQFEDRLVLGYVGTDNKVWGAVSNNGTTFSASQELKSNGSDITPFIGGPAFVQFGARMLVSGCSQDDQSVGFGWSLAPPQLYTYSDTPRKSVDTVALGITPDSHAQCAYAGTNDPNNNLTLQQDIDQDNLPAAVVYDDQIIGGPSLVTTVDGYAAAFVNKLNNLVLLYGVEHHDPSNVNRVILQQSSWHAPAVATINGVTYLAWIGTDDPQGGGIPTGKLNFADLGSTSQVDCAMNGMMMKQGGAAGKKLSEQLRQLRDQQLLKTPVGRQLSTLLEHHSVELERLANAHPDLGREAWALVQKVEPLVASHTAVFGDDVVQHALDLLHHADAVASPQLRQSILQVRVILPSFRRRTLHDGLAHAGAVVAAVNPPRA